MTLPFNGGGGPLLTSTQTPLASLTSNATPCSSTSSSTSTARTRTQSVETDIDNLDDDSMPLIPPGSPPVTVTHFTAKGKIEKIQLTPESSSVSSPRSTLMTSTTKIDNTQASASKVTDLDTIDFTQKEILLTDGPNSLGSDKSSKAPSQQIISSNPFTNNSSSTNPFHNTNTTIGSSSKSSSKANNNNPSTITASITSNNAPADNNNPFEQFDAITAALLTCSSSTNPFHNPFLMPTTSESEVDGSMGQPGAQVKQEVVDNPGCTKESFDNRVSFELL